MYTNKIILFLIVLLLPVQMYADVTVGAERLFSPLYHPLLKGKRIGLLTNHTAVNRKRQTTTDLLKRNSVRYGYTFAALFAPEHGLNGADYAYESVKDQTYTGIPVFSLHGDTRRPTKDMLAKIDLLIYDIQDIGSRTYTYASTLFYAMEEAAKHKISLIVLDRPNPINGITVDGPVLEEKWRSFVGYLNIPFCHGMTIGELAHYFNEEYNVRCNLTVVPMEGWKREMSFADTGLPWIPTSPYIPEATTPLYYATTGILGELRLASIGVGYTLPFKLVGAPWINADQFANALNGQHFPGVHFQPFHFRPVYGRNAKENCQGVLIQVTDPQEYLPVSTQFMIIGILKSLYPKQFKEALSTLKPHQKEMLAKVNGTDQILDILQHTQFVVWPLKNFHTEQRKAFLTKRRRHLIY